jgi:hypothetical protein
MELIVWMVVVLVGGESEEDAKAVIQGVLVCGIRTWVF